MTRFRRKRSRGQSIAEFALAIPLFLFVVVAIAEGGYYVVSSTIVSSATHEGARYGVIANPSVTRTQVRQRVVDRANAVLTLASNDVTLSLKSGGSTTDPCNDACFDDRAVGDRLKVTTTYTHTPLVGYVFGGITFPANAEAELRVEGDGPG